jgi:hypothetical protein
MRLDGADQIRQAWFRGGRFADRLVQFRQHLFRRQFAADGKGLAHHVLAARIVTSKT